MLMSKGCFVMQLVTLVKAINRPTVNQSRRVLEVQVA